MTRTTTDQTPQRVRIPADVDREDRVLLGLTGRQVAILAVAALVLFCGYAATQHVVPLPAFAVVAFPVAATAVLLAVGRRDGLGMDRLLLAAWKYLRSPRRLIGGDQQPVPTPAWLQAPPQPLPAPLRLPAHAIGPEGVIDLGAEGAALVCRASTVNFALRTPAEQQQLVAALARWLNSLQAGVQVLVRAERVDMTPTVAALRHQAPALPHPALEAAARGYADYLAELSASRDLLSRTALLVLHEPTVPGRRGGAEQARTRLLRRAEEAARTLAAAGVAVTVCDGGQARAVLAAGCDPSTVTVPEGQAGPGEVVTARTPRSGKEHPR